LKGEDIESFTDLADKRVGVHADGWRVLRLALQEAGADLESLQTYDCGYDPRIVIDGEADAMQCYYIDEFVLLERMVGERAGVFLARDFGYDAYSQVIFTDSDTVKKHPELVRGFLDAMKRGWAYAFENPEETVDLILSDYGPELDREYQLMSLAKIEELMIPEPGSLFRPVDAAVLEAGQKRLLQYGLMEQSIDIESILKQQFLP
jgi:ABC-type nitrate/sulfonate/bicarbonate transport system substrate-binding protein